MADPEAPLPHLPGDTDIRILLPDDPRFAPLADTLAAENATVRRVPYLVEDEVIRRLPGDHTGHSLHAVTYPCALLRGPARRPSRVTGTAALAAKDAFALLWRAYGGAPSPAAGPVALRDALPAEWAPFFSHPTLNPAQAEVVPAVLGSDENVLVVAPTGAGKTVMGMVAALKSILLRRRKAIWLVPQRSLTEELNKNLDVWRRLGLRVERLSGEHAVDTDRMRDAHLWLATTEKFEAVSRSSVLRQALAEVDCMVVDEFHLLGDAGRGATLEALFARARQPSSSTRVLGLSATIGNAEEIAGWLNARLLQVTWRASRLTWQLPSITAHADWNVNEAARSRLTNAISRVITADGGSVLVFCGSKRNVRRTALL
ncbi:MAG TPA: DEAD/DEAH box helicase, partial [Micromonosporaceae bacterium]|nr:DEAD/DEAH box helicase [Micromonosporaceae bacterium]